MRHEYRIVDAHVAGAPVRLLVSGVPRPTGATMEKRRAWLDRHAAHIRRAAVAEPRGHRDMTGALLTEPIGSGADAGLVFFDAAGYRALDGTALMAALTIALERGLIARASEPDAAERQTMRFRFETAVGEIAAAASLYRTGDEARVTSVRVTGVPSYALRAGCDVRTSSRHLRVDLAYAGGFYAIVDSEAGAVPLTNTRVADLRRLGKEICAALDGHDALMHPAAIGARELDAVVFTSQPRSPDAHLRCVSVRPHGGCDRSPGVGAMSAVMAVLNAMGLLREGDDFIAEGLLDAVQRGVIARSIETGDLPGVMTEVEGTAWITAEQTMIVDDADPLKDGFDVD